jgi:hypothetical protein
MSNGVQQLFQHVTLWSGISPALFAMNPLDAASLASSATAAVTSVNRYMMELRLQEIGLLKALRIDPDLLQSHLDGNKPISDFFQNAHPRPKWMGVHPNVAYTVDDIHQFRLAVVGAKRRINHWAKKPTQGRPGGLTEHLNWLQGFVTARVQLARLSVQLGEPEAGIEMFYDPKVRERGQVFSMEESLKIYFQVQRAAGISR